MCAGQHAQRLHIRLFIVLEWIVLGVTSYSPGGGAVPSRKALALLLYIKNSARWDDPRAFIFGKSREGMVKMNAVSQRNSKIH
jgi:hypothetical protein